MYSVSDASLQHASISSLAMHTADDLISTWIGPESLDYARGHFCAPPAVLLHAKIVPSQSCPCFCC